MAVARAGNSTNANADLNHITLRRMQPDGATQTMNLNLYDILKSGDINRDPVLQKNDLVYVPESGGRTDRRSSTLSILNILGNVF
jgi:polysaccharide export outer membrane protein